jgi:signal transduction histidine kinase
VKVYKGLSEAEAARGHFRKAYELSHEYELRLVAEHNERSARALALLRVRYDQDRQLAENRVLTQERAVLLDRNARAADEQRLVILIGTLSFLAVVSVLWLLSRKRLADAARRATEHRLEELGHLCAGVAHDFNNLMTVVQQAGGLLAREPSLSGNHEPLMLIDAIRDAARTGGSITRQLLAFGRQQDLNAQSIQCNEYFSHRQPVLQHAVGNAVTINVLPVDVSLTVWTDPAQLTSALVNLVLNAKDALPLDSIVTISVESSTSRAGFTSIAVQDTGSGMSADVLRRCTEVFFSTKEPGHGSGLGLSAVQGFASQSGGELQIESTPARGTTVTLILPSFAPNGWAAGGRVRGRNE